MPEIRTSARAILQRDGKLLVIRYCDEQGDFYALPGGSQQHGESLTDAVVREVAEETGGIIRAGKLRFDVAAVKSRGRCHLIGMRWSSSSIAT